MNAKVKGNYRARGVAFLLAAVMLCALLFTGAVSASAITACEAHDYRLERMDGLLRRRCTVCDFVSEEVYALSDGAAEIVLTEELLALEYTTPAEIRTALTAALPSGVRGHSALHKRFFEFELCKVVAGDLVTVGREHYPADGVFEIRIKASELPGFVAGKHDVYAVHMFSASAFGKTAGGVEAFSSKDGTLSVDGGYITFRVIGLSPVVVAWACNNHTAAAGGHACLNGCGDPVGACVDRDGNGACDICAEKEEEDRTALLVILASVGVLVVAAVVALCIRVYRARLEKEDEVREELVPPQKETPAPCWSNGSCHSSCRRDKESTGCPVNRPLTEEKPSSDPSSPAQTPADCPRISSPCAPGYQSLLLVNPSLAEEWHPYKNGDLKPCEVKGSSQKPVWWMCRHGHEWKSPVYLRNAGRGCPECLKKNR